MKKNILFGVFLVSILVVLSACNPVTTEPVSDNKLDVVIGDYVDKTSFVPGEDFEIKTFSSEEELSSFFSSYSSGSNYYGGGIMGDARLLSAESLSADMAMATDSVAPQMVKSANSEGSNSGGSDDFSQTNNQIAGVDEGDIIKTDGEFIYTVSGKTLFIVKAYPGEDAEIVSSLTIEKGNPSGLFINGDDLILFGQVYDYDLYDKIDYVPSNGMMFVSVYDISDKENPKSVKEWLFDGNYFESRMIDNYVYLISRSYPQYQVAPLPVWFENGVRMTSSVDSISYFPVHYDSPQFVSVHAINIEDLSVKTESLTVESSNELYMSENNLYLSYSKYVNEWDLRRDITIELIVPKLSDSDSKLIEKIKKTDNAVLSQSEKENKIYGVVSRYLNYLSSKKRDDFEDSIDNLLEKKMGEYEYLEYTVIHKLSVDKQDVNFIGSAEIAGTVNNQFSFDEYDSVLRVATTVNSRWNSFAKDRSESSNHIFTLDKDLKVLDHLDGIASGERIYSARFMKDRLYMVTFKQVDPFFVFDLSNPEKIEELGKLKIPGFSRYLHPYDDNTIIGIGRDATDRGRQEGLKVSLFDVSDVSNPVEIANYVNDEKYSSSIAEYEHKAFLFSKDKNLLVIPMYSYNYNYQDGGSHSLNGALVFDISKDGISVKGLVDHTKGNANNRYESLVERSLYINDALYTKSYGLLRINALDDLASIKDITLKQSTDNGEIPVY